MAANLACDKFWINKNMYHDAEKKYYENIAKLQPSRQNLLEFVKEKNEEITKKMRQNKAQSLKNCSKLCSDVEINSMRIELENLEKKNEKNENIKMQSQYLIRLKNIEIENNKNLTHHEGVDVITEKEMKQKEGKEKKYKSEKKNNRIKDKEDVSLGVGMTKVTRDSFPKTSLAGEVAKARQHLKSSLENMDHGLNDVSGMSNAHLAALLEKVQLGLENLTKRMDALEQKCASCGHGAPPKLATCKPQTQAKAHVKESPKNEADDDLDLFGSDSEEEESEEAKKIKEQRLAEYAAKKSKKPALVAKSNIILDIKPWDDETDMKEMEKAVRAIEMDGLVWGASKLVPVAFKIFKLQISCVVEDDKVSVDLLTETLEAIEDYIQSVDIAAFNKV